MLGDSNLSSDALQSIFSPVQAQPTNSLAGITEDAEFRTCIRVQIQQAQPRRNLNRQRNTGPVAIYEDPQSDGHGLSCGAHRGFGMLKMQESLRLAAKPMGPVEQSEISAINRPISAALDHTQIPRKPSHGRSCPNTSQLLHTEALASPQHELRLRKELRRRTIYIPSEDTTVLTVHPGRYDRHSNYGLVPNDDQAVVALKHAVDRDVLCGLQQRRQRPQPVITGRAALQPAIKPPQEDACSRDRPGLGPGKENLPPGYGLPGGKYNRSKEWSSKAKVTREKPMLRDRMSIADPRKGSVPRPEGNRQIISVDVLEVQERKTSKADYDRNQLDSNTGMLSRAGELGEGRAMAKAWATRRDALSANHYPLLPDDLHRPEMYDDHWLEYQETAFKQLVNHYFETSEPMGSFSDAKVSYHKARKDMLKQYQDDTTLLMYNRLQAALHFGALKQPQKAINGSLKVRKDIGLRRRFVSLWLDTYDLLRLTAALEVVTGRQLNTGTTAHRAHAGLQNKRKVRDELTSFIGACLLDDKDIHDDARWPCSVTADLNCATSGRHDTLLKSLMIVHLLDASKGLSLSSNNLFLKSSKFKSSREIVTELGSLLSPFGDIHRHLAHLGYCVSQKQLPLDEYAYQVRNLAVDLRDGVRLVRIVELLWCSPRHPISKNNSTSFQGGCPWVSHNLQYKPLSQYIVFPAIGRAQKIHNVKLAMDVLRGLPDIGELLADLRAEDVVDGHREKTLMLTWVIISQKGLSCLINLREVRCEIARIQRDSPNPSVEVYEEGNSETEGNSEIEGKSETEGKKKVIRALKAWTRAIVRLDDLEIINWTTAFANGRIFSKIVDHYEQYVFSNTLASLPVDFSKQHIDVRLERIGCSTCFASIFSPDQRQRVFDERFVFAALSFLCSRLLTASRLGRASTLIQRTYRQYKAREVLRRRSVLSKLARDCKEIVLTRQNVVEAAAIIQMVWREHRARLDGKPRKNQKKGVPRQVPGLEMAPKHQENVDIWLL